MPRVCIVGGTGLIIAAVFAIGLPSRGARPPSPPGAPNSDGKPVETAAEYYNKLQLALIALDERLDSLHRLSQSTTVEATKFLAALVTAVQNKQKPWTEPALVATNQVTIVRSLIVELTADRLLLVNAMKRINPHNIPMPIPVFVETPKKSTPPLAPQPTLRER